MSIPEPCDCCSFVKLESEPEKVNTMAETAYEDARILIFWDIENCPIPRGCKPHGIAGKLESALRKLNYRGEISSITAYGNLNHISHSVKQALTSTGIVLEHVNPRQMKNHMSNEMMACMLRYQAPANAMLISREKAHYIALNGLQQSGYNTLLAHPPYPPMPLLAYANTTWLLGKLLEEETET